MDNSKQKNLLITLGNQLFEPNCFLSKNIGLVFMAEDYELCTFYKHHKMKILFFLTAMREYRDELIKKDLKVIYKKIDEPDFKDKYELKLSKVISKFSVEKIFFFEIEDKFFEHRIISFLENTSITYEQIQSPMFITERLDFRKYSENKKFLQMGGFYQKQRKKFNLLIENNKPIGGKWSFDQDNRKKLPKTVTVPNLPEVKVSKYEKELKIKVQTFFSNHPGSCDQFWLPVTRSDAQNWLKNFLEERLNNFGFYEDSIHSKQNFMFHSAISPLLNIGLLNPSYVLKELENFFDLVPLNSYEGFIRQIIGWREFIRGIYQERGELQQKSNFFNHKRLLNKNWYTANTNIEPLDDAIKHSLNFGYTHHINRLMVIANIMNLVEISPNEIHRWFMEMFVDSSDWVMGPNVFGMSTFADGGVMSTKPYICGSNYILKMSDYKKGTWCDTVDGLYWRFIEKNKDFLSKNPRLSMMIRALEKIDKERKKVIYKRAEDFTNRNSFLN
ncbi:MAG: cryptochrome/photolyase family protein [Betaproteobacteria bacterium TMED156]|nr:MAG: cryptochrome/photolyase family protein [Betaproteobacteria bacterium TMED156]